MPNKKKPGDGKIKDLDVTEISIVDSTANRKKFAMIKSAAGESLEELLHFLQDKGSEELAMQKAESLGTEDIADYVEALSVLKKYDGCFSGEILDALAVLVGLCPQLQKAKVSPVIKSGGALDFVLQNLMLGSGNRRMVESVLKGASSRGELELEDGEEIEDLVDPKMIRGVSKSIPGQEGEDEKPGKSGMEVDNWPSL